MIVTRVARVIQHLLTERADELAVETGFVKRRRKLSGSAFAQGLVFGWLANGMARLTGLNQAVAVAGVRMSSSGLHQGFTAEAAEFMRRLLAEAVTEMIEGQAVAIPVLQRFTAVHIQDSTVIHLPEALAGVWQGCTGAALKVHVCGNLLRGGRV